MATASVPSTRAGVTWRDPKRHLWMLGLLVPAWPFLVFGGYALTGWDVLFWSGPLVFFGVFPVVDLLVGKDDANPPEDVVKQLEADRYYRWCTYAYLPLQYGSLVLACWLWASGGLSFAGDLGLAITIGTVAGIGINTAHELGHKRDDLERWLSKVALAQTAYGHFFVEHNRGHHVHVATPEDPASSRLGESFWAFLPRTVVGSLRSALRIVRHQLREQRGSGFWTVHNDVLNAWAMSVVLFGALLAIFGVGIAPWLAIQAVFGFCLLEVVNYLEHYGLLRGRREDGRYERTRPEHSWNSDNTASNVLLYHLQRHSDHHANPLRRYQSLRHFDEAPELPSGYSAMIVLAWLTPLWRRVMDPRVVAHYGGDVTRANIHPRTRERYLRRYGAPS